VLKLTVVGCSPAWPNPGGAQSGYLVEGSGRVLLDCGAGVLARLRAQEEWPRVDAIVITHFHLDHWADVVPWVWGALFGPGRGRPAPELWLPPNGIVSLEHLGTHFGRAEMFSSAFELREYAAATTFETAGFEITPLRLVHYDLETYGLRVACDGKSFAYSGDSAPCPELTDLARDADLFLCEATLAKPELDDSLRGHLTADEAVAAFREAGARRLLLTHRPRELPLEPGLEQVYDGYELEL
jgi:ribonuclease BN (tRNA processing enzyme)